MRFSPRLAACLLFGGVFVLALAAGLPAGAGARAGSATLQSRAAKTPKQKAARISAGDIHSCAVVSGGKVKCWGDNSLGELGNGTLTSSTTPVTVKALSHALSVGAGFSTTCALIRGGKVKCWGYDWAHLTEDGEIDSHYIRRTPRTIRGVSHAVALSSGAYHACVLLSNGKVKCWGQDLSDQLGKGAKGDSSSATLVRGLGKAVAVSAGYSHTCALLASGRVACWGDPNTGLGDGGNETGPTPVMVVDLKKAVAVSAGSDLS
jgi:alpha-tubulin suppressor-like RCC1 family protein